MNQDSLMEQAVALISEELKVDMHKDTGKIAKNVGYYFGSTNKYKPLYDAITVKKESNGLVQLSYITLKKQSFIYLIEKEESVKDFIEIVKSIKAINEKE